MTESEIQIPDEPHGDPPPSSQHDPATPEDTPYQNLWIPLVIVPGGIVIAIVLIFSLFGAISGEELSLAQNLERVLHGGKNDRTQAAFNLARQAAENHSAQTAGKDLPWAVEPGFEDDVRAAVDRVDPEEHEIRLVLGILLLSFDDPAGVDVLIGMLKISDTDDPEGKLRFEAMSNLALKRDPRATPAVLPFLEHEDPGLRNIAAIALQSLPGDGVREALIGTLADPELTVRGSAALSLAKLDPPGLEAANVLRDLLDPATYAAENSRDPKKFRRGSIVSETRVRAALALARLDRAEDKELLELLKRDEDLAVREAAIRAGSAGTSD